MERARPQPRRPASMPAKAKAHESETQPYEPHSAARSAGEKPATLDRDAAGSENLATLQIAAQSERAASAVEADAIDELAIVEGFEIIEETPASKPAKE